MIQSPEKFAETVIDLYGGARALEDALDKLQSDFREVWERDHGGIGRIVRSHVAVEYFLGRRLAADNPKLGSLEEARLSFTQMLALLDPNNRLYEELKLGLRLLNSIRNRVAHRPASGVTVEEGDRFLAIKLFSAFRTELARRVEPPLGPLTPSTDPLDILEDFARFVAGILQPFPDEEKWREALRVATSEGTEPYQAALQPDIDALAS